MAFVFCQPSKCKYHGAAASSLLALGVVLVLQPFVSGSRIKEDRNRYIPNLLPTRKELNSSWCDVLRHELPRQVGAPHAAALSSHSFPFAASFLGDHLIAKPFPGFRWCRVLRNL
jgi:hypothetical protein